MRLINEDKEVKAFLKKVATKELMQVIERQVIAVREELAKEYPLSEASTCDQYAGLCDEATNRFFDKMRQWDIEFDAGIICVGMHGEQAHNPICASKAWPAQHTWGAIKKDDIIIYVDPTCSQFKEMYSDIPDYYVGTKPPKWFYDDRKNPAWNGWTRWLNEHIKIVRHVKIAGEMSKVHDGIIDFWQYEIWGHVSDLIRKCMHRQ